VEGGKRRKDGKRIESKESEKKGKGEGREV
jgi:hypothetical protein